MHKIELLEIKCKHRNIITNLLKRLEPSFSFSEKVKAILKEEFYNLLELYYISNFNLDITINRYDSNNSLLDSCTKKFEDLYNQLINYMDFRNELNRFFNKVDYYNFTALVFYYSKGKKHYLIFNDVNKKAICDKIYYFFKNNSFIQKQEEQRIKIYLFNEVTLNFNNRDVAQLNLEKAMFKIELPLTVYHDVNLIYFDF